MHRNKTHLLLLTGLLIAAMIFGSVRSLPAQTLPTTQRARTREEELYRLDVRQAELALANAKAAMVKAKLEMDTTQTLYDEKLVAIDELNEKIQLYDEAWLKHRQAEIDQERKRLEFLKGATLITVVDAKKYRGAANEVISEEAEVVAKKGDMIASICLRNDSDLDKARIAMTGLEEEELPERMAALLKVDTVIVTLKGEAAIVGEPIQQVVRGLDYGEEVELKFRLRQKDIEIVTVCLEFLGETKEYTILLRKESKQQLPDVTSVQYSLIGQLGGKVTYALSLDRLAKTEEVFSLVVLNLPKELSGKTWDSGGQSQLNEIRFTPEISKQKINFEVSIPEKLDPKLIDTTITFYYVVTRREELPKISAAKAKYPGGVLPPEELAKFQANHATLTLIPTGVPKLEILAPNLYKEVVRGDPFALKFSIINSGTLALHRVTPSLDLPLEWEGDVEPKEIEEIASGQKVLVKANIRPPGDVETGEFPIEVMAEGHSGAELVEAVEKTFAIRVAAESSITGTVILVVVLIVLVLGIAIATIKISRR